MTAKTCKGKLRYKSRATAAKTVMVKYGDCKVYRCKECLGYHLSAPLPRCN